MLIYAASLDLQLPVCVTIHNQCSDIELASPVYFVNSAAYPRLSIQQIDIDTTMRVCFEIYITQEVFEGALLFKLQRYSGIQYNMDTLTTETNENETGCAQMLIAWKMKDSKLFVYAVLVKHVKKFIWNEDKLKRLYYENHNWFKEYNDTISDTWYMDDNMTLKTSLKLRGMKGNFELNISISEGERDDYVMRPLYVDLER
jgi:hypothetical protein